MAVTFYRGWAAASFHTGSFSTNGYDKLQFALVSSYGGLPKVWLSLYDGSGNLIRQVNPANYASRSNDGWSWISVPLSDLGGSSRTITRVQLQDASGGPQYTFYVDHMAFTGSGTTTVSTAPTYSSSSGTYPTGSYKPSQASTQVDNAIRAAVAKYNLPRWFYYSIIQRESSFNPWSYNGRDQGLTQLGGSWYNGMAYPEWLSSPNDNHTQYANDMNFAKYGKWILMSHVTRMSDPYNPTQNIERFSSGYAVPAFNLFKRWYGRSDAETLRMVAFNWNKGIYTTYDPGNWDYLGLYDQYVRTFKPICESQDGVWNGRPRLP